MRLRQVAPEQAKALEGLHAEAFDSPWSASDIARLMQMLGGFALAAEEESGTAGFILARAFAQEAEILTLAVAPRFRRRGLGRALVEAAAVEAAGRRADAMFLEVATDNAPAIALYQACGFERVGLRRGYYARPGGAADALVLRRALNTAGR